jgi:hypothetical protein
MQIRKYCIWGRKYILGKIYFLSPSMIDNVIDDKFQSQS